MPDPADPYSSPGPPPPPPRRDFWSFCKSSWIWGGTALLVVLWFPLVALAWCFDRNHPGRPRVTAAVRFLNRVVNRVNPLMRIQVEGAEHIDPSRAYVVVANHQSMADIPLVSRLPLRLKWVAKHTLFTFPFTGWMMRLAGDIPVDNRSEHKRRAVLDQATAYLDLGLSVMFFPEGRRSGDGRVYRFNRGAFDLAVATQRPLLPVAIDGLTHLLPMNTWRFGPSGQVRLRALPPVETAGMSETEMDDLRERVRFRIVSQLAAWRGSDPDEVDGILANARALHGASGEEEPPLFF
jgi:1-acyl-sn-glycerol-3-phosphate acyltransferase